MYETDKAVLKEIEKKVGFECKASTTREEFDALFSKEEAFKNVKEEHKLVYFEDAIEEAVKQQKELNKKLKKLKSRYLDHLYSCKYYKTPSISWEEVKKDTSSHYSYKDLNNEELAREIFEEFIKKEAANPPSASTSTGSSPPRKARPDSSEEDGLIREDEHSRHSSSRDKDKSHKVNFFVSFPPGKN